jgi:carbonic anhydrase
MALLSLVWLIQGRLAGVTRPESEADFAQLSEQGIRVLLNLGATPLPFDLLSRFGLQAEAIPIPDHTVPRQAQIERAVRSISWYLQAHLPVAVHGPGGARPDPSGLILACYLVAEGADAASAIAEVRARRLGAIETLAQESAVLQYEHHLRPTAATAARLPQAVPSAPQGPKRLTADEALTRLMEGNRRFLADRPIHPRQRAAHRALVASAQHPFAVVLGCSDSRVPVEIVLDQGIGDLFVIRSAGPVLDEASLASVEFAVQEFAVPLVLVLGHERCGAVSAAVEATVHGRVPPGRVGWVTRALAPAVEQVAGGSGRAGRAGRSGPSGDLVDEAVQANVRLLVDTLRRCQPVLAPLVERGELRVVGGRYALSDGQLQIIGS